MTKQVRFNGRGRSHGRKAPSGRQYTFRRHYWTDVHDEDDATHFDERVDCLEVRDKPTKEKAEETVDGFVAAVKKAGGSVVEMLDGMGYDQKHDAADELEIDVAGNASHDDLNAAIEGAVEALQEEGGL